LRPTDLYLIGWTLLGSILIYPAGVTPYIDALFFATGAATQSGLNTIDFNLLDTYQQVVIYLIMMVTNVIWINTFVVFVRLYWFERRLQSIAHEARSFRQLRVRTMSKSRSQAIEDDDRDSADKAEKGVNGRKITVLYDQGRTIGPPIGFDEMVLAKEVSPSGSSSSASKQDRTDLSPPSQIVEASPNSRARSSPLDGALNSPRAITFANEPRPTRKDPTDDNKFVEYFPSVDRKKNPKDEGALRIPGPREAEQGARPAKISDDEGAGRDAQKNIKDKTNTPSAGVLRFRNRIGTDQIREKPDSLKTPTYAHFHTSETKATSRSVYARPSINQSGSHAHHRTGSGASIMRSDSIENKRDTASYLSWEPTIGRNSMFVDLTEEQRNELGGIEYRSLKTLAVILVFYFVFWHLFGIVILVPWIIETDTWGSIVEADGQNRVWWGIFSSATMFDDVGFTLTPDSFISFQTSVVTLLVGALLIVIGNTGFPCMLRFMIWLESKVVPKGGPLWEEIRFLLDHPRRCFTLMFPSKATWLLFLILVALNAIDLIFFVILDLGDPAVTSLSSGYRVLNGLFQAVSTRTAGTSSVNIADLHPGIQVSYMIMMYISVFPIAISVRRTNVYEERSLGIYSSNQDLGEDSNEPSYIGAHLRRQLSFDLWFIFLGLFIIAIVEGGRIADPNDPHFTLFSCLFEIVSAYGTVGLSLGYPNTNASFSAQFQVISKLVIIAMQIRGRHRGLPYELDRAILLPSDSLHKRDQAEAARRGRRGSVNVGHDGPGADDERIFEPIKAMEKSYSAHGNQANGGETTGRKDTIGIGSEMAHHASGTEIISSAFTEGEFKELEKVRPPPAREGVGRFMAGIAKPTPIARRLRRASH